MTEQLELFNDEPKIGVGSKFIIKARGKTTRCSVIVPMCLHFPCCWIEGISEFAWFDFNNKVMYMVLDNEVYKYDEVVWL